jgi:hypothetical protein
MALDLRLGQFVLHTQCTLLRQVQLAVPLEGNRLALLRRRDGSQRGRIEVGL